MNIYENKTRKNRDKSAVQGPPRRFSMGSMGSMGGLNVQPVRGVRDFHRALQHGAGTIFVFYSARQII